MKANKILAAISAIAISVGAGQASAQEVQAGIFKIATGASQKIDRFGVCRVIRNNGENPIMVPTGSSQQWYSGGNSFLENFTAMQGISVSSCASPLPDATNLFIRYCSNGPELTWATLYLQNTSAARAAQLIANNFFGEMEYTCQSWPKRGSDGKLYIEYKAARQGTTYTFIRYFNDQGVMVDPVAMGLTFTDLKLQTCKLTENRQEWYVWEGTSSEEVSAMDMGKWFLFMDEASIYNDYYFPQVHVKTKDVTFTHNTGNILWPDDDTMEGCYFDYGFAEYYEDDESSTFNGRDTGQNLGFLFLKEWSDGHVVPW